MRLVFPLLVSAFATSALAAPSEVIPVWPDQRIPTWDAPTQPERDTTDPDGRRVGGERVMRVTNVAQPSLHVTHPDSGPSDTMIVIAPGGGFYILAWDLEGTEIAQWLNGLGFSAAVLKYRVPTAQMDAKWLPPAQDLQRSISLMRETYRRVGAIGFSAGAHTTARASLSPNRLYESVDAADKNQSYPDFAVIVYPAWITQEDDPDRLVEPMRVVDETPSMFFAHAADDRLPAANCIGLFQMLSARDGDSSELHIFTDGGHGFGGRVTETAADAWKSLCETWLRRQ